VALILCVLASFSPARRKKNKIPSHPSQLSFTQLDWSVPQGQRFRTVLHNAIPAYVAVDSTLPLISIHGKVRFGTLLDPEHHEGITGLTLQAMRTGGTRQFHPDTVDALIDRYAISLDLSADESVCTFTCSFLAEFIDTACLLLKEILYDPRFNPEKFEQEKQLVIERIKHRFDNPQPVLRSAYYKLMYPANRTGALPTIESIESIGRDECIAWHKNMVESSEMILAASGAFDRSRMIARLEKVVQPPDSTAQNRFPECTITPALTALIVHKQIDQAYVRIGMPLFQRPHPDYYPVTLLNFILGGDGFTSRLGKRVRSDAGLTYSIYSHAQSWYHAPSTLFINFFTRTETLDEALQLIHEEVGLLRETGITDEELSRAKKSMVDAFPSMFRNPEDIVRSYALNEYLGRDQEHFARYPERITAITKATVDSMAVTYLDTSRYTYTVVVDTGAMAVDDTSGISRKLFGESCKTIVPETIPELP
jgi:zinc protease